MISRLRASVDFHLSRLTAARRHRHLVDLPPGSLFVSFTFDDFPRSSLHQGARILEDNGATGTWYACLSRCVATGASTNDDVFEEGDVKALVSRGHELGCHTWSHRDLTAAAPHQLREEISRNAEAAQTLVPGLALQHFAWPYGRLRAEHKQQLGEGFLTLRTIFRGMHQGRVDLRLLRANRIYGGVEAIGPAVALIDRALHTVGETGQGVWLTFFTHELRRHPSDIGTTPQVLDAVVRYAVKRKASVMSVGEVTAHLLAADGIEAAGTASRSRRFG